MLAGLLTSIALASQAAPIKPSIFTAETAPDAYSRAILRHPLKRIHEGAQKGVDASYVVHRNFPQVIEQNFARLDPAGASALIDNMSDRELHDLAQLYAAATIDASRNPALLFVLAHRLDADRLARISKHFGFAPVYDAVVRIAPRKAFDFGQRSSPNYQSPVASAGIALAGAAIGAVSASKLSPGFAHTEGNGRFLNLTPTEIYLDFRTAPVGALGVTGALYETSMVLATEVTIAFGAGYSAGTVARELIQTYSPALYDAIGGTVAQMVDNVSAALDAVERGNLEEAAGSLFGLSPDVTSAMENTGGDFDVVQDWSNNFNGSNGSGCGAHVVCPDE